MQGVVSSNLTAPTNLQIQSVNSTPPQSVNKPPLSITETLNNFIQSSTHKSPKTVQTLREWLLPFAGYLAGRDVYDPLYITREHVDGFLQLIGQGRRGKPLNPTSLFGFSKDVQAFINFIADTLVPDGWRNPVRKLPCKHPQVVIRPLSKIQIDTLLAVADSLAPTALLKARNKAMLYVLLDGAIYV